MKSALLLLTLFCPGDWPQFRGANSDAHAEAKPTPMEWSDTKNVAWKTTVPGLGWSSPSVVDDRVYLTTAATRGEGLSLRAMALSTKDGSTIWDREVWAVEKAPAIHAKNSHASPTPIVHDGSVYVHFGAQGMAKLKASDGSIVWQTKELEYNPLHGNGGSPVFHAGKLVIACDGTSNPFIAAIDAETGKIAWKTIRSETAKISHSFVTSTVAVVDGKPQVLSPGPNHFATYDLETGKELCKVRALGWSVVPQPAVGHGMVYYNHDYDNPELMAVKLGGSGDVTDSHVVWRISRGAPSTPSPLLVGEELYFVADNGIASCVNALTGDRYWMERIGGNFSASPVFANDHVLFLNESGLATWIKPGKAYEAVGTCEVSGRTLATPAFSNGAMYLRTDEALFKIAD